MSVQPKREKEFEPRRIEVGIRELQKNLSKYVHEASLGSEIVITSHGKPLTVLSEYYLTPAQQKLVEEGSLHLPTRPKRRNLPPLIKLKSGATVSDLIKDQRR